MAYEPKDLTGSLFKNDRKNTDKHPDYTGSIMVGGQEYWLSAWLKDGKNGKGKWMSLGLKAKDAPAPGRQPQAGAEPNQRWSEIIDDGEIPF